MACLCREYMQLFQCSHTVLNRCLVLHMFITQTSGQYLNKQYFITSIDYTQHADFVVHYGITVICYFYKTLYPCGRSCNTACHQPCLGSSVGRVLSCHTEGHLVQASEQALCLTALKPHAVFVRVPHIIFTGTCISHAISA